MEVTFTNEEKEGSMEGTRDVKKWDDVYRNVCCELGGGIAIHFNLSCVCFYIRLFNTGKILLL